MHGRMECCFKSCMNPQVCFWGLIGSICKQMTHFVSIRYTQLICQQSPKLALSGSNMGLMLTASANLITKVPLMLKTLSTIVPETGGDFYIANILRSIVFHPVLPRRFPDG